MMAPVPDVKLPFLSLFSGPRCRGRAKRPLRGGLCPCRHPSSPVHFLDDVEKLIKADDFYWILYSFEDSTDQLLVVSHEVIHPLKL